LAIEAIGRLKSWGMDEETTWLESIFQAKFEVPKAPLFAACSDLARPRWHFEASLLQLSWFGLRSPVSQR
jgi:hypothetical protein